MRDDIEPQEEKSLRKMPNHVLQKLCFWLRKQLNKIVEVFGEKQIESRERQEQAVCQGSSRPGIQGLCEIQRLQDDDEGEKQGREKRDSRSSLDCVSRSHEFCLPRFSLQVSLQFTLLKH